LSRPTNDTPDPIVHRDERGSVQIQWDAHPEAHVYAGTDPHEIEREEPIGRLEAGVASVTPPAREARHFYELVPPGGGPGHVVGERLLPLSGANNFRDLGGYPTLDGRRVRWGHVFRSDHLAELTQEDLSYIGGLGIRLVCDFRGEDEIGERPNRLPAEDPPKQINPSILGTALMPGEIRAAIQSGNPDGLDFRTLLQDGNRTMATRALDQFRALFDHLEHDDHVPLLFHCTAGKDRTGLAAALILIALGVSEDVAMNDYLLTATYTHDVVESTLTVMRFNYDFKIDLDEVRPLMSVRREFLQSAFDGIRDEYGSFDRYFVEAFGLTADRREALRARLVV
jgi:protein-tyrosine phosphatase